MPHLLPPLLALCRLPFRRCPHRRPSLPAVPVLVQRRLSARERRLARPLHRHSVACASGRARRLRCQNRYGFICGGSGLGRAAVGRSERAVLVVLLGCAPGVSRRASLHTSPAFESICLDAQEGERGKATPRRVSAPRSSSIPAAAASSRGGARAERAELSRAKQRRCGGVRARRYDASPASVASAVDTRADTSCGRSPHTAHEDDRAAAIETQTRRRRKWRGQLGGDCAANSCTRVVGRRSTFAPRICRWRSLGPRRCRPWCWRCISGR